MKVELFITMRAIRHYSYAIIYAIRDVTMTLPATGHMPARHTSGYHDTTPTAATLLRRWLLLLMPYERADDINMATILSHITYCHDCHYDSIAITAGIGCRLFTPVGDAALHAGEIH